MLLRMHFTAQDLSRVHLAAAPDPIWETTLALHQLTAPASGPGPADIRSWRRRSQALIEQRRLGWPIRLLTALAPSIGYYPDFLTPPDAAEGLGPGLEAVRATPLARVREEVGRLVAGSAVPAPLQPWLRDLAGGDRDRMAELVRALKAVHDVLVGPAADEVDELIEADLARRRQAERADGVHGLLGSFSPLMRWQSPVLRINYSVDRDVRLDGRGLRLVPSYFGLRTPLTFADPNLAPILVYPVDRGGTAPDSEQVPASLSGLLGRTRARVLVCVRDTMTNAELAARLQISAASVSEHIHVLIAAGLVRSYRLGAQVLHTLTPLGAAMLRAQSADPTSLSWAFRS